MRFAYADPPYIGMARRHYGPDAAEVNHPLLVEWLCRDFDAWALSCSTPSLRDVLPVCPPETRVCAWVKPWAVFKANVRLAYAWEPVLLYGVRQSSDRSELTVRDWVSAAITMQRGTVGAKPEAFSRWLFAAAGLTPADEFHDVFPGSGAVQREWDRFAGQGALW